MVTNASKITKPSRVLRQQVIELQTASYKAMVTRIIQLSESGKKPVLLGKPSKVKLRFPGLA